MGLISRLFRREQRYADGFSALGSWPVATMPADPGTAPQGISAVMAGVNFVASNVASLPPLLYRIDANGDRTETTTHPVCRVLQQPNSEMSWAELIEFALADALLSGNALIVMDFDLSGRLVSLTPVPWRYVSAVRVQPSGMLAYDILPSLGRSAARYLSSETIHLRDRGDHPLVGRSRIARAAATMHHARSADVAASSSFERSGRPSGAFKITGRIDPGNKERFEADIREKVAGAAREGKILVLQDGLDFAPYTATSARDQELLASRQWSLIEIARIFGIPPVLLGDWQFARGPVAMEALTLFANTTMRHWVTKIEGAFNGAVFAASTGARFALALDMSALMRADPAVHSAVDNVLLSHGVITPNESRESWGYSPSNAAGMDMPTKAPQAAPGGYQTGGTQPGGMVGAPG